MFSGNEWLVLVGIVGALAILIGLVLVFSDGPYQPTPVHRARLHGEPGEVVRDLQLATSGLPNSVAHRSGDASLTWEWSYYPGWSIVISVICFPIGLLALLAKRHLTGTAVAEGRGDGTTTLLVSGQFRGNIRAAINSVIDARSTDAVATEPASQNWT